MLCQYENVRLYLFLSSPETIFIKDEGQLRDSNFVIDKKTDNIMSPQYNAGRK